MAQPAELAAQRSVRGLPLEPVLILGAGINGCALARELLLNGVSAWIVDVADAAAGATSYSSRLIHGGLRYLEYGEFDLVRESLAERTRLLRLAPQFVRPLRLFIPAGNRSGGFSSAIGRFVGWGKSSKKAATSDRGLWLIRSGLTLYDLYARDKSLPRHTVSPVEEPGALPVDASRYRWLCGYSDAQITYPERFVMALLRDAQELAQSGGLDFRLLTYHEAGLNGPVATIASVANPNEVVAEFKPAAVVNATGAWVDLTLARLPVRAAKMMGGTKGSHLFTSNERLKQALAGRGIYAEAADGRPIFITPLANTVLVGTTDEPFKGSPETAVATPSEIEYLLSAVNSILPHVGLIASDIDFHYSGVRPLPASNQSTPGAVTRRHWLEKNQAAPVAVYSVIGGKLTTCRSLAEEAAAKILGDLGIASEASSRERPLPGAEGYPADQVQLKQAWHAISSRFNIPQEQVHAAWSLCGARTRAIFEHSPPAVGDVLPGTNIPCAFIRWSIEHEWVRTLDDLVERRLMLLYHQRLTLDCLRRLAGLLVEAGLLAPHQIEPAIERTIERLGTHFGKRVAR